MAARFVALGNHHVHPILRVVARLLHVPAEGHDLHAEPVGLGGDGSRIAEAGDEHGHALLEGDVDPSFNLVGELLHLVPRGTDGGEEHVHPEGLVGEVPHAANLVPEMLGCPVGGGNDPEPTRGGHGGGERRSGDPAHAGLADGVADAQQVAQRCMERAGAGGGHG